jgi:hypothetical protein
MGVRLSLGIAITALLVAVLSATPLGNAAYNALAPNSVGAKQIKTGAVTNVKLRGDAVTSGKVLNGSLRVVDFKPGQIPAGPKGDKGDKGDKGAKGDTGSTGLTGVEIVTVNGAPQSGVFTVVSASCPEGKRIIGGGARIAIAGAFYDDVAIESSYPLTQKTWQAVGSEVNATAGNWILTAYAICAATT